MKKAIKFCLIATLSTAIVSGCSFEGNNENAKGKEGEKVEIQKTVGKYTMPDEKDKHEGTWLQWPHEYTHMVKSISRKLNRFGLRWQVL